MACHADKYADYINYLNSLIPATLFSILQIIVKKLLNRSLFDTSMIFCIVAVYSITKDMIYNKELNRSKI